MGRLSNLQFYDHEQQLQEDNFGSCNEYINWDYNEQEQEDEVIQFIR